MFPPNRLLPNIVEANGTTKINVGGQIKEMVLVELEVDCTKTFKLIAGGSSMKYNTTCSSIWRR